MIDSEGYRANVAVVLINDEKQVFWCRRIGQDAWQFPQGGMDEGETPEEAMFRELREETGLLPHHVDVVGRTRDWLKYNLPEHLVRHHSKPVCIGQKQVWFLLQFRGTAQDVDLVSHGERPEFDDWSWVDYEVPAIQVVDFKQDVYQRAMYELKHLIGHS